MSLPQVSAYPGLQAFVQEETLTAAQAEVEKAKTTLAEAEKKWHEAAAVAVDAPADFRFHSPLPSRERGRG